MVLKKALCCSVLSLVLGNAVCMSPNITSEVSEKVQSLQVSSPKISVENRGLYKNLSPTLAIMKMFLKDDFKSLTQDEAGVKNNLRDNIRAFFGEDEFTPNGLPCGGAQDIILDKDLTDILCDLVEREQKESLKGNVTLYHGMAGSNLFVYKYFARLFSHLTGRDFGDLLLRGDHLYARNPKTGKLFNTLREVRNFVNAEHDYVRGVDISTLHCNIALSVGPGTSLSTASAVGFLCNSFSASEYPISELIIPTLVLQGMSIADAKQCAEELENLFNRYFSKLGGGLLAISLSDKDINKLALHVQMGGEEYDPAIYSALYSIYDRFFMFFSDNDRNYTLYKLMKIVKSVNKDTSINEIVKKIDDAYFHIDDKKKASLAEQLKDFSSLRSLEHSSVSYLLENLKNSLNKDLSNDDVRFLTNEISLYLHPEMKAEIFGTFRHPLPKEDMRSLDSEINTLAVSHAESIMKGAAKPVDGSFVIPRKIAPSESISYRIDLLPIFIEKGMVTEAEQVISQYSKFLEDIEITRLSFLSILKALNGRYPEIKKFIRENDLVSKWLSKIPEGELYPLLREFAYKYGGYAIGELLTSSSVENLDDRILTDLISGFLSNGNTLDFSLNSMLEKKQLSHQVMEDVLSRLKFGRCLDVRYVVKFFINKGFSFNPNEREGKEHLDELSKIFKENFRLSSYGVGQYLLDSYGLNKEDCPQLAKFLDGFHSEYDYNKENEKRQELKSYLESDRVGKEDKKFRIRELNLLDQLDVMYILLDSEEENLKSLGEELSKEIDYPGSSMSVFDIREAFKKYVL